MTFSKEVAHILNSTEYMAFNINWELSDEWIFSDTRFCTFTFKIREIFRLIASIFPTQLES